MARFFLPCELWECGELPHAEARHASQVLRLVAGDQVEIFDGTGRAAHAELSEVRKSRVAIRVMREWREERPRPEFHLIVALIKNERLDWLVQKATELGAASIRPVSASRSVVKLAGNDAAKRRAKWMHGAVEAAKQCGHVVLPEIYPVCAPAEAFRAAPAGLRGIPSVLPGGVSLNKFFACSADDVTFAIGPEGDWTPDELQSARLADFVPLDLGRHVLRSETAALHVVSAAAHHYLGGPGGRR